MRREAEALRGTFSHGFASACACIWASSAVEWISHEGAPATTTLVEAIRSQNGRQPDPRLAPEGEGTHASDSHG